MELTLVIATLAILLGLMLFVGFLGLMLLLAWLAFRRFRSKDPRSDTAMPADPAPQGAATPVGQTPTTLRSPRYVAPPGTPRPPTPHASPLPTATPRPVDAHGTPVPAGATAPPPPEPPPGGGLIGFDEPTDHTQTELFQRGAIPWDDEDDEPEDTYDATEIFSAHGPAGDLAEFHADHRATPPGMTRRDKP